MGCDVHIVVEKKVGRKWVGVYASDTKPSGGDSYIEDGLTGRNYDLFGALAGVRREGPAPKGLPKDMSDLAKLTLSDDCDLHSKTWYSLREAMNIYQRILGWEIKTWNDGSRFSYAVHDIADDESFRILFAFDN